MFFVYFVCKLAILYTINAAMLLSCTVMSGLHLHVTGPDENTDTNLITISCFLPKNILAMENLMIQLFSTSILHFEGNNFNAKYAFLFLP